MNGSKYAINHDFFTNITTEEQTYLLGFYIADGNINEKRKTFRICITEEDKDILEMFRINISPDSRFYYYKPYQIKRDNMYRIVLQSKSELYLLNSILYKNSHLFMSRKKNKFDHYVNTEILHKTDGDCNA